MTAKHIHFAGVVALVVIAVVSIGWANAEAARVVSTNVGVRLCVVGLVASFAGIFFCMRVPA